VLVVSRIIRSSFFISFWFPSFHFISTVFPVWIASSGCRFLHKARNNRNSLQRGNEKVKRIECGCRQKATAPLKTRVGDQILSSTSGYYSGERQKDTNPRPVPQLKIRKCWCLWSQLPASQYTNFNQLDSTQCSLMPHFMQQIVSDETPERC
jgi:hypothetical protein